MKKNIKELLLYGMIGYFRLVIILMIFNMFNMTKEIDSTVLFEEKQIESHVLYKFREERPFTISKDKDVFVIRGEEVERLFRMTNFNTEEAYERFSNKIRRMGIDDELEKMGVKEGDIVRILDFEFEWTR